MGKSDRIVEAPKKKLGARERNRAALIRAAQRCLIESGHNVTIEHFADFAEVSPATIYKHFQHKEEMFTEALRTLYEEWLIWAFQIIDEKTKDPLSRFVLPSLLLANMAVSHPDIAKAINNSGENSEFLIRSISETSRANYQIMVKNGLLPNDKTQLRFLLFTNAGVGLFLATIRGSYKPTSDLIDEIVSIFAILGLSEAKTKKILSTKLL